MSDAEEVQRKQIPERIVNDGINKAASWLLANNLTLNIKKFNYVVLHTYQKK